MHDPKANRRRFLAQLGSVAGGSWLALNAPAILAAAHEAALDEQADAPLLHLNEVEAAVLAAVADQVIPPDDLPGAADAGVVRFIDRALGGFMAGASDLLGQGVLDLERRAASACPDCGGFAALPFDEQTKLLESIEDSPFFTTMITLTHCGLFAMPSWGGNRDKVGWKLLGFEDRHAWQPPFGYYDAQPRESEHDG